MSYRQYEEISQFTEFPQARVLFSDFAIIGGDLLALLQTSDAQIIISFADDFLRLKNLFKVVDHLVPLGESYENLFIRYGRETLAQLLRNAIFASWGPEFEQGFLRQLELYYSGTEKRLLRVAQRLIQPGRQLRFAPIEGSQIDVNSALFNAQVLAGLLQITDIRQFLTEQVPSTPVARSVVPASPTQAVGSALGDQAQHLTVSQDQLKTQIIQTLQSRLAESNAGTVGAAGTSVQIEALQREQATLVYEASEKINKYKAKLGQYRALEKEMSVKIAMLDTQNAALNEKIEQLRGELDERRAQASKADADRMELQQKLTIALEQQEQMELELKNTDSEQLVLQEKNRELQRSYDGVLKELGDIKPQLIKNASEASVSGLLRDKLLDMNRENADLVLKYNKIVEQIQAFASEIKEIEGQKNEYYTELMQLREAAALQKSDSDALLEEEEQLKELRYDADSVKLTNSKLQQELQTLQTEIDGKSEQLQSLLTENMKLKEETAVVEEQANQKSKELADNCAASDAARQKMELQMAQLEEELEEQISDNEGMAGLRTEISAGKEQIASLTEELEQRQQQNNALQDEIGALKLRVEELTAEQALNGRNAEFEETIQKLKQQNEALENQLLEVEKRSRELELQGIDAGNIKVEYEQLELQYAEKQEKLEQEVEKSDGLQLQLRDKELQLQELEKQLEIGKTQLLDIENEFTELESMNSTDNLNEATTLEYEEQMSEKDAVISDLNAVASQYEQQAHELQEEMREMVPADKANELLEQIETLAERIRELESENAKLCESGRTENFSSSNELRLEKENELLKQQLSSTERTINLNATGSSASLEEQLRMKDEEIQDLRDELDNTVQELEMIRDFRLRELEKENQELKQKGSGEEMIIYRLNNMLEEEDEIAKLDTSQEEANPALDRLKSKIRALIE